MSRCCAILCKFVNICVIDTNKLQMSLHSDWQNLRYYIIKMSCALPHEPAAPLPHKTLVEQPIFFLSLILSVMLYYSYTQTFSLSLL